VLLVFATSNGVAGDYLCLRTGRGDLAPFELMGAAPLNDVVMFDMADFGYPTDEVTMGLSEDSDCAEPYAEAAFTPCAPDSYVMTAALRKSGGNFFIDPTMAFAAYGPEPSAEPTQKWYPKTDRPTGAPTPRPPDSAWRWGAGLAAGLALAAVLLL
jgi:hypothetical protein